MNKASQILFIYQIKQFAPGIGIGGIAALFVLGFYLGAPLFTIYDELGQSAGHQVGTVTNIVSRPVSRGNVDPSALISIQVGNKAGMINSHSALYVGQKLSVDYRIGRSGTLYIDHFLPMIVAR
ncbi:MAG: hypothetical protein ACRYFS_12510 [Janthinobacterium lividum]